MAASAHRLPVAGLAAVVALATSACQGDARPEPRAAGPETTERAVEQPEQPGQTASSPDVDADDRDDVPADTPEPTSAGPLTADDMPPPDVIGPNWSFVVVDGDPHDTGFVSNDAATHARNPADVAALVVPLGCAARSSTRIVADYVLDATYASETSQGVALRMRFDDASTAAEFLRSRHDDLVACADQAPAYDGREIVPSVERRGEATVSLRTEPGVPGHWAEVAARVGDDDVVVLAVQNEPPDQAADIARRLAAGW